MQVEGEVLQEIGGKESRGWERKWESLGDKDK